MSSSPTSTGSTNRAAPGAAADSGATGAAQRRRQPRRRHRWVVPAVVAVVGLVAAFLALRSPGGSGGAQPGPGASGSAAQGVPAGWTQVWRDDFNGPAGSLPSTQNWIIDKGTSYPGGAANWGTGEVQAYTDNPANVHLDGNGRLLITPLRDASGGWTSARIETRRSDFRPQPGGVLRFESRLQLPAVSGRAALGYWPSFWALGAGERADPNAWPRIGEFDILENVDGDNIARGTMHCGVGQGGPCNEKIGLGSRTTCPGSPCDGSFHTYSFEWDRSSAVEQLRWYVDDKQYWTVKSSDVDPAAWADATHNSDFLLLNLAVGGEFPNALSNGLPAPNGDTKPGVPMTVDYVAVYAHAGAAQQTAAAGSAGPSAAGNSATAATSQLLPPRPGAPLNGGAVLTFRQVDFGSATPVRNAVAHYTSSLPAGQRGKVEFRVDNPTGPTIGSVDTASTAARAATTTTGALHVPTSGVHDLYVTVVGAANQPQLALDWLTFTR